MRKALNRDMNKSYHSLLIYANIVSPLAAYSETNKFSQAMLQMSQAGHHRIIFACDPKKCTILKTKVEYIFKITPAVSNII